MPLEPTKRPRVRVIDEADAETTIICAKRTSPSEILANIDEVEPFDVADAPTDAEMAQIVAKKADTRTKVLVGTQHVKNGAPPAAHSNAADAEMVAGLSARELVVAVLTLQQVPAPVMARTLGIGVADVHALQQKPQVTLQVRRALIAMRERIERGDFGVVPMAKANAESMMQRLVALSQSTKEETARRAAVDVLSLAGHVAVKKAEIVNVNRIIDAMDPVELTAFVERGEFPARFRDQLATIQSAPKKTA